MIEPRHDPGLPFGPNCVPDHAGLEYGIVLSRLHEEMRPRNYLEIGTLEGVTLALSRAPSISIDPVFQISTAVIGSKPSCLFYQMESDAFFNAHDPTLLFGSRLDFAFLDGMHRCEFLLRDFMNAERHAHRGGIIALHDCLPTEIPMTDREPGGTPSILPHRNGWWTGDVWRVVLALKRYRPDLNILCLDAKPTGLVIVTGLDPRSRVLHERYDAIVQDMMSMTLEDITVAEFLRAVDLQSTAVLGAGGDMLRALRLTQAERSGGLIEPKKRSPVLRYVRRNMRRILRKSGL